MALTPERKAALWAELDKIIGLTPLLRPKVVTQDGVTIAMPMFKLAALTQTQRALIGSLKFAVMIG